LILSRRPPPASPLPSRAPRRRSRRRARRRGRRGGGVSGVPSPTTRLRKRRKSGIASDRWSWSRSRRRCLENGAER